ncbi:MAG: hypothetical protein ABIR48_04460 [Gammaproteobacteria bacterium]
MIKKITWAFFLPLLMLTNATYAIDSYRYLHVSIETPWRIFLFLLIGILAPFVVMVWLYWRHARRDRDDDSADS